MYVAIERKPEDGCEIQNSCDGVSGIMMQLKLVKTQAHETAAREETAAAHAAANAGDADARDAAAQIQDVNGYVASLCVCILFFHSDYYFVLDISMVAMSCMTW